MSSIRENSPDVLDQLRDAGYRGDFDIATGTIPPSLVCRSCNRYVLPSAVPVEETRRVEGPLDRDDEQIVLALRCPRCGTRGTLLAAYGTYASHEEVEVIAALNGRRAAVHSTIHYVECPPRPHEAGP